MDLAKKLDKLKNAKSETLLRQLGGQLKRGSDLLKEETVPAEKPAEFDLAKYLSISESPSKKESANPPDPLELVPEGEIVENDFGKVLIRRTTINPFEEHSRGYQLPEFEYFSSVQSQTFASLLKEVEAEMPLEGWAFIDTETTGLMGGTGTYIFLMGIGYFRDGCFELEQYFMLDYSAEGAMIEAIDRKMKEFRGVVSYNGKAFDIPLLRTRFIFNRKRSAFEMPHWDHLHLARRCWKKSIQNCRLTNVEREILGLPPRQNDIPGAEIPQTYFDYLNNQSLDKMQLVFDHHAQDIISLGALALRFCRYYQEPELQTIPYAETFVSLSKLFQANEQLDQSLQCLENALLLERDPEQIYKISMRLSKKYKRLGRYAEAVEIWQQQIQGTSYSIEPYVELAKYYEHHTREFELALQQVDAALKELDYADELKQYISNTPPEKANQAEVKKLTHRMNRLKKKINLGTKC